MKTVFIDGREGTTGLRIESRIAARPDLREIVLPDELRKDSAARKDAIAAADIVFLCLPDAAAREAAELAEGSGATLIDASTAHRTAAGWEYGFPELSAERAERIASSKRIAVPGCHASGFVALVSPLVAAGILPASARLGCFSLTGYSGGGKKMIADYERAGAEYAAPRQYALAQQHKHLPEMKEACGLETAPVFCPVVGNFYSGMEVTVPLFASDLAGGADAADIRKIYSELYDGDIVFYRENADEAGFLSAGAYAGKDTMEISVHGSEERILLTARFDNLGKGASGAAVECMNLVLGDEPGKGLVLN